MPLTPPRKKSLPLAVDGLTTSEARLRTSEKLAPPFVDSYTPTVGAPGGENRPPFTDEDPCRATAVPMNRCCAWSGSIATAPIDRSRDTARLPATSVHVCPPL